MPRKSKARPDDPEQSKRPVETEGAIGVDEDRESFERAFKKIFPRRPAPPKSK
jgi:hypothetical protein